MAEAKRPRVAPPTEYSGAVETSEGAIKTIKLTRLENAVLTVTIEGITPVIPHAWSAKSRREMRDRQTTPARTARAEREPKNPEQEAHDAQYYLGDESIGLPATGFKGAIVGAARLHAGVTMTELKQILFVEGEGDLQLVRLRWENRVMREDTPRNANGVADLRYRYSYFPWECDLRIHYPKGLITPESILSLVDSSGYGGVCDWRPSSPKSLTGSFGRYRVKA